MTVARAKIGLKQCDERVGNVRTIFEECLRMLYFSFISGVLKRIRQAS